MHWRTIPPLIRKDLTLFFRNRFYAFITFFALAAYIGMYYILPDSVEEWIEVGLFAPASSADAARILEEDGIHLQMYGSKDTLRQAVLDKEIGSGLAFPENLIAEVTAGNSPTVEIYLPSDAGEDTKEAMQVIVEVVSLALTGHELKVDARETTLGRDMAGEQIAPRDRMLPLFAVVLLMFETMGLASLLAEEIQADTIRALLATPMGVRELFIAKGTVSVTLVFLQALALMAAVGALRHGPLILLTALFLGALLVTGIGFLMAAAGKDMLSVMAWGVLVMILLGIPSFGILFPGTMTGWARLIPSYYLADTVHQVVNFGAGWTQITGNLLMLLAWDAALLTAGVAVLKRKFS